jgi:hypothetical protein
VVRVFRFVVLLAVISLTTASAATAQPGHGRRDPGGQTPGARTPGTYTPPPAPPPKPPTPLNQDEIVGVVKAIDPAAAQVTIAYEAVDARNWPPGTMPFTVYKSALLKDVTVGERVRFKLDGQQITELLPY